MVEQLLTSEQDIHAPLHMAGPIPVTGGLVAGCGAKENEAVSVFRGLPYAAPPVGDLRWKPPQPPAPWPGVREATSFGPACPQPPGGVISMFGVKADAAIDEDCLYLNVWTPAGAATESLPVMVWIHGGGLRVGSADNPMYNGVNLAAKDVLVVTLNYRLNVLGGFAHPGLSAESENSASGNYGLMDQIAALRWVGDNIASFGGDPANVTTFGESAGCRSIALLMVAPQARGLFHRAICQSGMLRDVSGSLADREAMGLEIAAKLGCDRSADPIAALRAQPWEALHDAVAFDSNPFVDGWVIPEDPCALYAQGKTANTPVLIGTNADEATMFELPNVAEFDTLEKYKARLSRDFGGHAVSVISAYPASDDEAAVRAMMALRTDIWMTLPARRSIRWLADAGVPCYFYHFTRVPPWKAGEVLGAHHGAEIAYEFGGGVKCGQFKSDAVLADVDQRLSDVIMAFWVNFARTGDPNAAGLPNWPQYDSNTENYLELGDTIQPGSQLRGSALDTLELVRIG